VGLVYREPKWYGRINLGLFVGMMCAMIMAGALAAQDYGWLALVAMASGWGCFWVAVYVSRRWRLHQREYLESVAKLGGPEIKTALDSFMEGEL